MSNDFNKMLRCAYKKQKEDYLKRGYWVHGVKDVYADNPMIENWVNVHTHGLENYGLTNISIVAPKDDTRLSYLIYTVADMMKNGEVFQPNATHFIDDANGECIIKFKMLFTTCFGEYTYRLILPDPITNKFSNEDNYESIYCLQETYIFKYCEKTEGD